MDAVLQLSKRERAELFQRTTQQTGIDTAIVEKDFWVCWTLKELFRLPEIGEHLIFKSGTSLSKVFKVIERFSQDIDVSIDRGWLGFGGANEPEAGASNKEKQRRIEALKTACQQRIANELSTALETTKGGFAHRAAGAAPEGAAKGLPPDGADVLWRGTEFRRNDRRPQTVGNRIQPEIVLWLSRTTSA